MPNLTTKIRIARPTNNLEKVVHFYRDGLGFEIIAGFEDHNGFDGVMLGLPSAIYHLEFTHHRGHVVPDAPTQDNLLILYLPDHAAWLEATQRMKQQGYEPVKSYNPYWDVRGKTFQDHDGYRVVLQNAEWSL
jgi:catechol 2,3-dioxygenase-like lactoylglutathione lyase family enzyme